MNRFNNPLKLAAGGQMSEADQQEMYEFVD